MIALLQTVLDKAPPHRRAYQIAHDLKKQEMTKQLRDELRFVILERDISAAVMDNLRANMDQSDGLTPEIIAAELPEFFNDDFRSTMGLAI